MKKMISVLLTVLIFVATACSCNGRKETNQTTVQQYVIALNPSIMLEDGKVNSLRNTVASAIKLHFTIIQIGSGCTVITIA